MMKNRIFLTITLFFLSLTLFANEKIYLFESNIEVLQSSDIIVTETIKVRAEGNKIKRGIYRAIPNTYKTKQGIKFKVKYEVIQILRDGKSENYHIKNESGYSKIYIGNKNYFLPAGDYTYTIKYKTNKQIGYYEDFDEIYWNVNGVEWDFTIDKIIATVSLPKGTVIDNFTAYTGKWGESNKDYKSTQISKNIIEFVSTKAFAAHENMSIAVGWPKGIVHQPDTQEKVSNFFKDNIVVFIGLIGALFAFLTHLFNWKKVGIDPPEGTIIPLFKPPSEFSPSAMRYILKMKTDNKAFTAALVSMATKGAIKIEKKTDIYYLRKEENAEVSELTKSEEVILTTLLGNSSSFKIDEDNHSKLRKAITNFKNKEEIIHQETYFKLNRKYLIGGIVASVLTVIAMFLMRGTDFPLGFSNFLSPGFFQFMPLIIFVFVMFKNFNTQKKNYIGIIMSVAFMIMFYFSSSNNGNEAISSFEVLIIGAVIFFLIVINLLFAYLMKAPTLFGRKEMDKIEGFKMYLKTAEEERLNAQNIPDKTPKLFEKYLPYAIALDCENQWADKFKNVIQEAIDAGTYTQPTWYIGGHRGGFYPRNFVKDIGTKFNNTVVTSSIPPSQRGGGSGGSIGGGFSGGGGGGGGGGGW